MFLRDVLYVPGLKKNLLSISMIKDKGLGVYILDGKVYIFPKAEGPSASYAIGVRCGKLYKLLFQPHHALSHSQSVRLTSTRKVFLHASVLACKRL